MSELIDREALKDAVKRYAGEPIKKKDKKCQAICLDMLGIIDALPSASPWHRVEEPPKKTAKYLVWVDVNNGVFAAYPELRTAAYNVVRERWYVDGDQRTEWIGTPRYWMPIEPPKEEV